MKPVKGNKLFTEIISINPMPTNCHECPFYYMPRPEYEGTWYEDWDCYLGGIKSNWGIALERSKHCPLNLLERCENNEK